MEKEDLEVFIAVIRKSREIDLSSYRKNFLLRRLNYRMKLLNSGSIADYLRLLKHDDKEFNKFLETLAINVSQFFRDPEVFDYFRKYCLPEIIRRKASSATKTIRIWSAGCAQGQEPYSLAIMMKEELVQQESFFIKIWGTDIDKDVLERARAAEYDSNSVKEVGIARLKKYFRQPRGELFSLNDEIREMVRFSRFDLFSEPPFKYVDLIFCRNVMIYFDWKQQDTLFRKFHKALRPGGYLVIGKVETIRGDLRNKFLAVTLNHKIFQKNIKN
ncbi:CheR family methyltransferase [Candidatus Omnitrophota bacterium]